MPIYRTPKRKNDAVIQWLPMASVGLIVIIVCALGIGAFLSSSDLQASAAAPSRLSYVRDGVTYSLNMNTNEVQSLGTVEDTFYAPPVSPDGNWTAAWEMNGSGLAQVIIYNAKTLEPVSSYPLFSGGSRLSWSADSQSLLMTALGPDGDTNAGMSDLWLMDRETGAMTRLTFTPQLELDPVFSPDGTHIAYIVAEDSGEHRLYVMDMATQSTRTLTTEYKADRPSWSPDGQWIAFEASKTATASQIAMVHPDSTDLRILTDGTGFDFTPTWIN